VCALVRVNGDCMIQSLKDVVGKDPLKLIANRIGMNVSSIRPILNGDRYMSVYMALRLQEIYGWNGEDYLFKQLERQICEEKDILYEEAY